MNEKKNAWKMELGLVMMKDILSSRLFLSFVLYVHFISLLHFQYFPSRGVGLYIQLDVCVIFREVYI